jgi:hypothetical protein
MERELPTSCLSTERTNHHPLNNAEEAKEERKRNRKREKENHRNTPQNEPPGSKPHAERTLTSLQKERDTKKI